MKNKIIFTVTSVNSKTINLYSLFLKKILTKFLINFKIVNLPTKKRRINLLKSPHVYKKAWEHFELKKYKKKIIINNILNQNFNLTAFLLLKNRVKNLDLKIKIIK
jgi:ribosomal protein S10